MRRPAAEAVVWSSWPVPRIRRTQILLPERTQTNTQGCVRLARRPGRPGKAGVARELPDVPCRVREVRLDRPCVRTLDVCGDRVRALASHAEISTVADRIVRGDGLQGLRLLAERISHPDLYMRPLD